MTIAISFDPTDGSDLEYVRNLLSTPLADVDEAPAPRKVAKAKSAAEEPAEDEPTGPSLQDAIDKATELVSEGRTAEVKGALTSLGVKRVGELEESQIAEFLEALEGDGVV